MPLEIIGPGFGRTGTNSLKLALEHLGFGPCHHMFEVRDDPELLPDWEAAARGEPGAASGTSVGASAAAAQQIPSRTRERPGTAPPEAGPGRTAEKAPTARRHPEAPRGQPSGQPDRPPAGPARGPSGPRRGSPGRRPEETDHDATGRDAVDAGALGDA